MSATTANGYSEKNVFERLMAKVRSGTDQEVIEVLNAPIAPGTAFGDITLLDAISEINGVTLDDSDYASVLEAEGAASDEGSLRKALFSILFILARGKKQDAFEFLKGELSRRGITHVQMAGTIYGMDWEGLHNIDDSELREQILDGKCEDLFPSSCGRFSGRPYKRDCPDDEGLSGSVSYELEDITCEDFSGSDIEVTLRSDKLDCDSFRDWVTNDFIAGPLEPLSLYGDRTKDADKFTLVIKLDPRLTASA